MMKRNYIASVLFVGLALTCQTVYSQKTGKDVMQFNPVYTGVTSLSIAPDSRAGAMGDVGYKQPVLEPLKISVYKQSGRYFTLLYPLAQETGE